MYEAFFGLSGKPFQLNPDPNFYYESKGHRRARAYLEYGLHQGEGFIVITGEVGAGKTTLLRGVLERLPRDSIVATQIVSTQVDADDMLRLVSQGFGLTTTGVDKSTLLTELRRYCLNEYERGKKALLIVDEAQNLPPGAVEELRMLSNFQIGSRSLVQSFLVGQPELRQMLQDPQMRQLKQRIIASYHLGPMEADETRNYVEHRLRHVGWSGDPSFDDAAFQRIHDLSEGIPRRINGLCDRLLLSCYLASGHEIQDDLVQTVAQELAVELEPAPQSAGPRGPQDEIAVSPAPAFGARGSSSQRPPEPGSGLATDLLSMDRLEELEERVAFLESRQHSLQLRVKRLLRQSERPELKFDADG
jgi:putative secretion ATPase (PEP-CTERM system associated)